ncbi:MAG: DUF5676 family membrane protein, partial [Burkholderiales bacterium]
MLAFVLCVLYGLVTPESWHMHELLEQVLPGFKWLNWRGFSIGLVESFLYGVYGGASYCLIHNALHSRLRSD